MLDFIAQRIGSRPIEVIAVFCGLANVSLIIRRTIWNYPFGFLMGVLYAKIFYDYQLYSYEDYSSSREFKRQFDL